ncbi:MAG: hypothetical protein ACRDI2_21555, partial [Chloroflexota bacterium]
RAPAPQMPEVHPEVQGDKRNVPPKRRLDHHAANVPSDAEWRNRLRPQSRRCGRFPDDRT